VRDESLIIIINGKNNGKYTNTRLHHRIIVAQRMAAPARLPCCPECKQLAPRPRLSESILDVDAATFLPRASIATSSYRMDICRRVSKIMYKLDLPINFERAKLIAVYSLTAMRLGTSVSVAVAYVIHLILAEHFHPHHPEHALSCHYLLWLEQIQDEDQRAADNA